MLKRTIQVLAVRLLCGAFGLWLLISTSDAAMLDATITADNHYALYYGTDTNLTFVGRNEKGSAGNPGAYNWSFPEVFSGLQLAENDRFYVVIWDESVVNGSQALLAQFTTGDGGTLLTNASQWGYYITGEPNPGTNGDPPPASGVETLLSAATWTQPGSVFLNGTEVWAAYTGGPTPGISTLAYWICRTACDGPTDRLTVYRSIPISEIQGREIVTGAVPEPPIVALLGIGIVAVLVTKRRRNASARIIT